MFMRMQVCVCMCMHMCVYMRTLHVHVQVCEYAHVREHAPCCLRARPLARMHPARIHLMCMPSMHALTRRLVSPRT